MYFVPEAVINDILGGISHAGAEKVILNCQMFITKLDGHVNTLYYINQPCRINNGKCVIHSGTCILIGNGRTEQDGL